MASPEILIGILNIPTEQTDILVDNLKQSRCLLCLIPYRPPWRSPYLVLNAERTHLFVIWFVCSKSLYNIHIVCIQASLSLVRHYLCTLHCTWSAGVISPGILRSRLCFWKSEWRLLDNDTFLYILPNKGTLPTVRSPHTLTLIRRKCGRCNELFQSRSHLTELPYT